MTDPTTILAIGTSVLAVTALIAVAGLRAFGEWLSLRRFELDRQIDEQFAPTGNLIEIADLRERVRKLEAIAAGIDP
ncbi:hypothetical protein WJT74_00910 [Sphingomicrobium sp. XHP0239]|uniref:hypothetical protein n=1 Tax=Sphingomicrobium maritimum TaxID=3133972 RepID=UPI0031CCBA15